MSPLPFEILVLIFEYLKTEDLLQCQLTSKRWYEASVKQLYSEMSLNGYEKSCQYVQTISNSSRLGSYLKAIVIDGPYGERDIGPKDKQYLLRLIISQCPNILEIRNESRYSIMPWEVILSAAKQGLLSHLQCLPPSANGDLEPYICTALSVKESLTTLNIDDHYGYFKTDLSNLIKYQILCDNISKFSNLQHLTLSYQSKYQVSHFDRLIDDCKHLKTLNIDVDSGNHKIKTEHKQMIQPRQDICAFSARWEMLDNEDQLRYVIQKFPNLQSLKIDFRENNFSFANLNEQNLTDAITEFLSYVINIPNCEVSIPVKQLDLAYAFTNVKKLKDKRIDVKIESLYNLECLGIATFNLRGKSLEIDLRETSNQDLFHTNILPKLGNSIQSLDLHRYVVENSTERGYKYISDSVQLCPSLQELTLSSLFNWDLSYYSGFQHTEIKSLCLTDMTSDFNLAFLKEISEKCLNLKQLDLQYRHSAWEEYPVIKIFMPYTRLDSIKWNHSMVYRDSTNYQLEVYFRLKTYEKERFYQAIKDKELILINEKRYIESSQSPRIDSTRKIINVYFDITCRSLTKLDVLWLNYLPNRCSWAI